MTDQQRFETTTLPLAASLLSQVPGAVLLKIASEPSIDGKPLIVIGYPQDQRDTVRSLGLRKIRETHEVPDNEAVRGMIHKVRHLVKVVSGE